MNETKNELIDELCERFQSIWSTRPAAGSHSKGTIMEVLHELLADSMVVYSPNEWAWDDQPDASGADTHCALLVGIRPIKRKVKVSEIVQMFRAIDNHHPSLITYREKLKKLADRIEQHGIEVES